METTLDYIKNTYAQEQEMIQKGKNHWSLDILSKRRGGYVDSKTVKELIDKVIENTWTQAKVFYENRNDQREQFNTMKEKTFEELIDEAEAEIFLHGYKYYSVHEVNNLLQQVREATNEEWRQAFLGVTLPAETVKKIGEIITKPNSIKTN